MRNYTLEELNEKLSGLAYPYRIVLEVEVTSWAAHWLGRAGFFDLNDCSGGVWIDSNLDRYIILTNGQIFQCSNTDLTTLSAVEKMNIKGILSGLID